MFLVYILYSPQLDKFYVGVTEDLDLRISQHNTGFLKILGLQKVKIGLFFIL